MPVEAVEVFFLLQTPWGPTGVATGSQGWVTEPVGVVPFVCVLWASSLTSRALEQLKPPLPSAAGAPTSMAAASTPLGFVATEAQCRKLWRRAHVSLAVLAGARIVIRCAMASSSNGLQTPRDLHLAGAHATCSAVRKVPLPAPGGL